MDEHAAERREMYDMTTRLRTAAGSIQAYWERESWNALTEQASAIEACAAQLRQIVRDAELLKPTEETPMPASPRSGIYHPDPEINGGVAADALDAERADLAADYLPSRWRCECGAEHGRGHFMAIGIHRCLGCGYVVGPDGVMLGPPEGSR